MSAAGGTAGFVTSPVAMVDEARQALARLEQIVRASAVTDPAQAYYLMGASGQVAQSLQRSLDQLAHWWGAQERDSRLQVTEGAFADDPSAAVATTIQSLAAAASACADLTAALERAQMCSADLTPAGPRSASRGRDALRRWRRP
ncbi:MAG: hypothetical protein ACR2FV_10365 [Ornithinimicrobium sp.]|uniref:hypothetical protein n=1 Tax=Ornithinimicrobium sp. TaxID=1977084 RepID=UPI0017FD9A11|nr:hypothetical protein [Actinomycetota bacterium]